VEHHAVIKAIVREKDEVVDGLRRLPRQQLDLDAAAFRFDDSQITLRGVDSLDWWAQRTASRPSA